MEDNNEVTLRTGIDPNFLADTLTTDIELTDALFDLIDNSIDSARNAIIEQEYETDIRGLPSNYTGYEVKLRFSKNSIIIVDNCLGVESNTLENNAFYTGKRSNHKFGIGHYGLGLKRALLKAGSKYGMITDNGQYLYKSNFDRTSFSSDDESSLIANKSVSSGRKRTLFIVTDLHPNVISQISDNEWLINAINELSIRYSIFLRKGLKITFINSTTANSDSMQIMPIIPLIRSDGIMRKIESELTVPSISCDFSVGVHEKYRFPGEKEHSQKVNQTLTKSYGIYYICNDRVIVSASTEDKHGFTTQWHSEYGGFVCLAYITGENPKDLPWNTAKTEIKINSPLFLQIRKEIEPLTERYRSQAKELINLWKSTNGKPTEERKSTFAKKAGIKSLKNSQIEGSKRNKSIDDTPSTAKANIIEPVQLTTKPHSSQTANKNKKSHIKDWDTLLPKNRFPITNSDGILDSMLLEACTLEIDNAPYASSLLYRSIFESAFRFYVKKNNLYKDVKEHYYSKGEGKKKNHSAEYKQQQGIDLSICSNWMIDNKNVFPPESRKKLEVCSKNLKSHIKNLNGMVHGNHLIGNDGKVQNIRNETIELLEFLVLGHLFKA